VKSAAPLALAAAALAAACDDPLVTFPLEGQLYHEAEDCLDPEGVIDVIEGEASGTCDGVRCFRSVESDDYFVTSQCEVPNEFYEDHTAEVGGVCEKALAAYAKGASGTCPAE
jgi:hypothetical protein